LRSNFTSYKDYGIDGIQPLLLITKGDTFDEVYITNKKKIYDDATLQRLRKEFCLKAQFPEENSYFIANYLSGRNFEKDPVVDFTALFIVTQALSEAKALIRRVARAVPPSTLTPSVVPSSPTPTKPVVPSSPTPSVIAKLTIMTYGKEDNIGFVKNVNTATTLAQFRTTVSNSVDDLPSNFVFVDKEKKQVEVEGEGTQTVGSCIVSLDGKECILVKTYSEPVVEKLTVFDSKGESLGFLKNVALSLKIVNVRNSIKEELGISQTFKVLDKERDPLSNAQEKEMALQECLVTTNGKISIVLNVK